jgi:hypothetical protein
LAPLRSARSWLPSAARIPTRKREGKLPTLRQGSTPNASARSASTDRHVVFTSNGRHDLGGAEVTHAAPSECTAAKKWWPQYVDKATDEEIDTLCRCRICG